MVGALDVDHLGKAALPLGDVVGHVRHKVGVRAVRLFHHTVFVVAVIGGLEPQSAVLFVGLARRLQTAYRIGHFAARVQAAFQVVVVKLDVKGFQVEVLFVAQVGHGELAHAVHIVHIATGGEFAVIGLDGFTCQEIGGDVLDVVAVVKGFALWVLGVHRPAGVAGLDALGAKVRALGQGVDLHACVVVIKLAVDIETLRGK